MTTPRSEGAVEYVRADLLVPDEKQLAETIAEMHPVVAAARKWTDAQQWPDAVEAQGIAATQLIEAVDFYERHSGEGEHPFYRHTKECSSCGADGLCSEGLRLHNGPPLLQPPPAASERCGECLSCGLPIQLGATGHSWLHVGTGLNRCGPKGEDRTHAVPATGATAEHEEAWITCAQCGKKRHVSTLAHGADTFVCRHCLSTDAAPAGATSQQLSLEDLAIQAANYLDEFNLIESKHLASALRAHVKSPRATSPAATAEGKGRVTDMAEPDADGRTCLNCGEEVARQSFGPPINTSHWYHVATKLVWCESEQDAPSTAATADAVAQDAFEKSAECEAENCEDCRMSLCDCCCHDI